MEPILSAIQCAISAGATIDDFAGNGLDSGASYLAGTPASLNGLTPDTGAAFPGINPLVGQNQMMFPIGRSTYTPALQATLKQNVDNPLPYLKHASLQVSYALSRFNSMAADQTLSTMRSTLLTPRGTSARTRLIVPISYRSVEPSIYSTMGHASASSVTSFRLSTRTC